MITALGSTGPLRGLDGSRADALRKAATAKTLPAAAPSEAAASETAGVTRPAAGMAAEGPPVDTAKVEALRAAIGNGSYAIDPQAIARAMIATDLGR